jgi:hypothetical protein
MLSDLRIEIKTNAAEAKACRLEELRLRKPRKEFHNILGIQHTTDKSLSKIAKWKEHAKKAKDRVHFARQEIYAYRTGPLKNQQRATYLIYAYFRGVPYFSVEAPKYKENSLVCVPARVFAICSQFLNHGSKNHEEYLKKYGEFTAWLGDAA